MTVKTSSALPLGILEDYLSAKLGSSFKNLTAKEFTGGGSNPTYLLESDQGQIVLRSKPLGKLVSKAHAIDREYRVKSALGTTGFPVPETYHYCADTELIGAEFYIMEYIEGRVFEDFTLPDVTQSGRADIYDSMNETIARLHRIDPDRVGLNDFGKPGNYFERQIKVWNRQYEHQDRSIPAFEDLASWLTSHLIKDNKRAVVHGDFRLANIVVAPKAPEVAAVLDWELSTLGHPLADFAYNLSQWYLPNFNLAFGKVSLVDADLKALGIPDMSAYAQHYFDRTGEQVTAKDLYYSIAFNLFRLAGIIIGVMGRAKSGTAKNEFARSTAHNLEPTIDLAWQYAQKADAC